MKVHFWGTRGSIAKPGPDTLRHGGNTACVEVRSSAGTIIVIDCGTGVQDLGQALMAREAKPISGHVLISHTHWDHIQGFPFFAPLFVPGSEWDIYAPRGIGQALRDTLAGQMQYTYFPITLDAMGATIRYHDLVEGAFEIEGISVRTEYLNHPALTLGYRLEADGVSVVYACDHEPYLKHLAGGTGSVGEQDRRHAEFLRDADLVIHDAQFTAAEYASRTGWGHSTVEYAVTMCRAAKARRLALTHHDPMRTDDELDRIVSHARTGLADSDPPLDVFAAAEGMEIEVKPAARAARHSKTAGVSAIMPVAPAMWEHVILIGTADEKIAKQLLEAAQLEDIGVAIAKNAEAAIELSQSGHPTLVILDETLARHGAVMPAMRSLAANGPEDVPIVMIADNQPAKLDGITDWLTRPVTTEYLRTRMRAWVLRNTCRWVRAPQPADESRRLSALRKLKILDTEAELRFDRITRLAAALFRVPIALVSLVDRDRQWFKSCYGHDKSGSSRDRSFCAHAILSNDVMVVPDTLLDTRFADHPSVLDKPRYRFYAGCPLTVSDGSRIGTLCILDTRPREFDETRISLLQDLGALVERELSGNGLPHAAKVQPP